MSDEAILIIITAAVIVAAILAIIYVIDTWPRRRVIPDEPYGDASDTPTTLHNVRRSNHARGK